MGNLSWGSSESVYLIARFPRFDASARILKRPSRDGRALDAEVISLSGHVFQFGDEMIARVAASALYNEINECVGAWEG